jgi:plasmid replication initiation protein
MKRTLDLTPRPGEMLKPKELMEIRGTGPLTLQDRRVFNTLVRYAWGPDLGKPGKWFEIPTGELRDDTDRNKRLQDTIERLMQTIVVVVENGDDGEPSWEHRTPLLSSNSLIIGTNRGVFRYRFTEELVNQLKDSTIFAKLDLEVMRSFRSKYAFSLYEAVARRIRMKSFMEELSVEDLRELLGVEDGRLTNYRNLNLRAIQPAIEEVNAISPFAVSILPKKKGKKVVSFLMGWNAKSEDALREAYAEMQRHSTGRRARIDDTVQDTVEGERFETPESEG